MFPPLVTKYMSPIAAGMGGISMDGLRLHVRHRYSEGLKKSYYLVGLYHEEAVFESAHESIEKALDYFTESPWYPSADGETLVEAFSRLENKLRIAIDYVPANEDLGFHTLTFLPMFNYTRHETEDQLYQFDARHYFLWTELKYIK